MASGRKAHPTPAPASAERPDIAVKIEGPERVPGRASGTYVATVSNVGTVAATNVPVVWSLNGTTGTPAFACSATGGAVCPTSLATQMTLSTVPPGGALTFTLTLPVSWPPLGAQSVMVGLSSTAPGDARDDNGSARVFTYVASPWSGRFTLFGADARQYTLELDRDAFGYALSGEGIAESEVLTRTGDGTSMAVSRTAPGVIPASSLRLRFGPDLVAGSLTNKDGEIVPFVGLRRFVESIADLPAGDLAIVGRVRSGSSAFTMARSARLVGAGMLFCASIDGETIDACPLASLVSYALSTDAGEIRATVPATGAVAMRFRIARIGDAFVLVRAERSPANSAFWVGLPGGARGAAAGSVRTVAGAGSDVGAYGASLTATGGAFDGQVFMATSGPLVGLATTMTFSGTASVPGVYTGLRPDMKLLQLLHHPLLSVLLTSGPGVDVGVFAP